MTNPIEIAPEIRELLEDIVADPRSSIRLAPRRALREWFTSGETIGVRGYDHTKAERHLLEVHREAVAELLFQAARVAYWKKPSFTQLPIGEDGKRYNPADREGIILRRIERELRTSEGHKCDDGVDLLRQCLGGVHSKSAMALAQASLSLVPGDKARYLIGLTIPWNRSRLALGLLRRMAECAWPTFLRAHSTILMGARLCSMGMERKALEEYREATAMAPELPFGGFYAFNLCVYLGDRDSAEGEAAKLMKIISVNDQRLHSAQAALERWVDSKTRADISGARKLAREVGNHSEIARVLAGVYER